MAKNGCERSHREMPTRPGISAPTIAAKGAYAAWPPMTAKALYKIDSPERIWRWLREVAKAGNQGPIGQAHFVEDVYPPVNRGAFKSSEDAPFIEGGAASPQALLRTS